MYLDKSKILSDFANGDYFSVFKAIYEDGYYSGNFFENHENCFNLIKNSNAKEKQKFLELYIKEAYNTKEHFNSENQEINTIFNKFWKNKLNTDVPFFFYLVPILNDDELSTLIKEQDFYWLQDSEKYKSEKIILIKTIFDKGMIKTVEALEKEYWIKRSIDFYTKCQELNDNSLSDYISEKSKKNLGLIKTGTYILNQDLNYFCENFFHEITEKKENNEQATPEEIKKINYFFDNLFLEVNEETQEKIIALTLRHTNHTKFLEQALKKLNIESIRNYHPKHTKVWEYANLHIDKTQEVSYETSNTEIYSYLFSNGIPLYDKKNKSTDSLIGNIYSNGRLNGDKIIETFYPISKVQTFLTKEHQDYESETPYTLFQLLCQASDYNTNKLINIDPNSIKDLNFLDFNYQNKTYADLPQAEKIKIIETLLEKTWFAPIYKEKNAYISVNQYCTNQLMHYVTRYNAGDQDLKLVDEHIKLTQNNPKKEYQEIYFSAIELFINSNPFIYLNHEPAYKTYSGMIDYFSTNKNLPWETLLKKTFNGEPEENPTFPKKFLENKKEFYDGAKNIYSYLYNITLSHTIIKNNPQEEKIKKMKI